MKLEHSKQISYKLKIAYKCISAVLKLLEQGNTIPFISRYRKEATNNLDEIQILDIKKESGRLIEIDSRRAALIKGMEEQGAKYRDYFNFSEPLKKISSHHFLAIKRAEKEKILKVSILPQESDSL